MRRATLLTGFALIMFLMIGSAAEAAADGREDAMCTAIYTLAVEQYEERVEAKEGNEERQWRDESFLEYYTALGKIIIWEQQRNQIHAGAYNVQTMWYIVNMDTATALLHYDRCFRRTLKIYVEYRNQK